MSNKHDGEKVVLDKDDMGRALTRIAHEIVERNPDSPALALIGIHRRGAFLAQRLRRQLTDLLGEPVPLGDLDIGFYRDDVARKAEAPIVHASHIDFDVDDRTVVIVDDVLYTGRTVRAAIEALFDYGRPARVQLAVLADRGHRELPIRPDYVGKNLPTSTAERVYVRVSELDGADEVAIAAAATPVATAATPAAAIAASATAAPAGPPVTGSVRGAGSAFHHTRADETEVGCAGATEAEVGEVGA